METNEEFQLLSLDDAYQAWRAMPPAERENLLAQPGGWAAGPRAKSKLNSVGRQLVKRSWIEHPELTKRTIRDLMVKKGIRPKARAKQHGTSSQSQALSPAEYMPPVRRVVVNVIGPDGLTDAERAAGKAPLA